jgi:hypothetical protein
VFKIGERFDRKVSPLEALEHARMYIAWHGTLGKSTDKPGYVIEKLSRDPEFARAISELTSDMTRNERIDWRKKEDNHV